MAYPYIIQGGNITVVIGSTPHTVSKTHITYPQVLEAIKAGDWDRLKEIIDPVKVVLSFGQGNVSIEGEVLMWKNRPLHSALATRMIAMLQEGFDVAPMANFMENLFANPSKRAVDELYSFLEKNALPITPDGFFLAYKRVRHDYKDCHTGTMDNSVGQVVEMERNEVDDNKDRTCSAGLHFCAHSYLGHFSGDRVVIVKINPRDVVSIPSDYNDAKGRACRYEVIGEVGNDPKDEVEFTRSVQRNAWSADLFGDEDTTSGAEDANWEMSGSDWDDENDENDEIVEPKRGSGMYIKGYDDGYNGRVKRCPSDATGKGGEFYSDGWEAGSDDAWSSEPPRYEWTAPAPAAPAGWTRHDDGKLSPPSGTVFTAQNTHSAAVWPFPTQPK